MSTIEDFRELTQMHGRRGHSPPSEKLNQLSECGQSEYRRDEIALLPHALNPLCFGVGAFRRHRRRDRMGL